MHVNCVLLDMHGEMEDVIVDDSKMCEFMGGEVTFVGAIPNLQVVAIGRSQVEDDVCKHGLGDCIEENTRGKILLVGSDENGEGIPIFSTQVENFKCSSLKK